MGFYLIYTISWFCWYTIELSYFVLLALESYSLGLVATSTVRDDVFYEREMIACSMEHGPPRYGAYFSQVQAPRQEIGRYVRMFNLHC
jgi:hypothetical protein